MSTYKTIQSLDLSDGVLSLSTVKKMSLKGRRTSPRVKIYFQNGLMKEIKKKEAPEDYQVVRDFIVEDAKRSCELLSF